MSDLPTVIVRCCAAGCFIGKLKEHDRVTRHAVLVDSRRLWFWSGAASLSQLATDGTSNPGECKFPCIEPGEKTVAQVEEIIPTTQKAIDSIGSVKEWKQ